MLCLPKGALQERAGVSSIFPECFPWVKAHELVINDNSSRALEHALFEDERPTVLPTDKAFHENLGKQDLVNLHMASANLKASQG